MPKGTTLGAPAGNHLLEALPDAERETLVQQLRPANLAVKTVLFDPGQPIPFVHFPIDGVISLVTPLADGNIVEVATIGNEGIVGVPLVPGGSLAVRAISQVGGRSLRMEAAEFIKNLERLPVFRAPGAEVRAGALRADLPGRRVQPPPLQRGTAEPLVAR